MKITVYDIIIRSAEAGLKLQYGDGSMPSGHNGPYKDEETPVRNTSHWLITYLKAFEITQETKFESAAKRCLDYLMSKPARPMDTVFWHRKNRNKDFSNGLMGQAWTIESLVVAYRHFEDKKIIDLAIKVFLQHPYDAHFKAWKTVNVDGSIYGYDMTFNHQLWFSAMGTMLSKWNTEIKTQTDDFNSSILNNIELYPDGVIKHLPPNYICLSRMVKVRRLLKTVRFSKDYLYYKSVGYHGFNLYALALIHKENQNLAIFESRKFNMTIQVLDSPSFKEVITQSKYGYPYNPPGLEIGFALQTFCNKENIDKWLTPQIEMTFNFETGFMNLHHEDLMTSAARIYEACRLENYIIQIG